MKLVLLSDLHFKKGAEIVSPRRRDIADILLLRLVHRINRFINPDFVFVLGDVADDPRDLESAAIAAEILKKLTPRYFVVRGNHDLPAEEFYKIFPRPPETIDEGKYRFEIFHDAIDSVTYNARRSDADIARLRASVENFPGRTISVQHVPLVPRTFARTISEYSVENVDIPRGLYLSLAGHQHEGFAHIARGGFSTICAPALSESPFSYQIVELDDDGPGITVCEERLRLPPGYTDSHMHTHLAYCAENLTDHERLFSLIDAFGLECNAFTEHSGHLYVGAADYWGGKVLADGFDDCEKLERFPDYLQFLNENAARRNFIRGLELDVDARGKILVDPRDEELIDLKVGAVHKINKSATPEVAEKDFLMRTEALLAHGCRILAHPFRIFTWHSTEAPPRHLYVPVVALLEKYHAAAEINFHAGNNCDPEFYAMCAEHGVELALGSDAHNLYEIGEFYAALKLLGTIGATKDNLIKL